MTRSGFMRFAIATSGRYDQGKGLTVDAVMSEWQVSRATAYRLLSEYFDAQNWQWPRPRDTQLRIPRGMGVGRSWREEVRT